MRTILAGFRGLRRTPLAAVPLALEGLVGGVLVLAGAIPASASGVPSTAVFPLDIFFDLKQSIAFGRDWSYVIAALGVAILIRGGVLAATLWLSDGRPGSFALAWARGCRMALIAVLALLPSAAFFFTASATRYAPFVYVGAILGLLGSILLARKGVKIDVGGGEPQGGGVPEAPNFITYAYIVTAFGAAMSFLAEGEEWPAALILVCLGPVHALFLVGWREHVRNGTFPGGGTIVTVASFLALLALFSLTAYDRYIRDPAPVRKAPAEGMLIVLGGADSTLKSGALADLDPRVLGYPRGRGRQLSYRGPGKSYTAEDTRKDLVDAAKIISKQVATAEPRPRAFIGHSQAGLILDRMIAQGLPLPERAVLLATPPATPPNVDVPPPDKSGPGRVGGDLARLLATGLDKIGVRPFDIDAPASPTNLRKVETRDSPIPRLEVWALADSVWLEDDWRRPGETNIVALTDHVGVTDNAQALAAARDFFAGKKVPDDESSWKGVAVGVLRYAFAPWRPE
ncbi:MAG: hypothetical protein M3198_01790 [Actinomycetota bacterium]|nr:hypothetical protein [Actinomycetota bacterium]